ncbi:MAG: PQQ-like beta-propeller repeat protein [Proteobacteria bacterium]|nr:PQQ-like beta-propeller repeat protein [Pseudomonadota bacterium]MBS0571729.1 PQQ-like beta-propeller repeat protein [Pseudomonadota bacterium]
MTLSKTCIGFLALGGLLVACGPKEEHLPGERLNPRDVATGVTPDPDAGAMGAGVTPVPVSLPAQRAAADWPQTGGNPAHLQGNAAFSGALSPLWSVNIGQPDSRKDRITADPVVAGGRVFTLDATDGVTATGTNGGRLWRVDLTPASDRPGDGSGGGLAVGEGRLFVTTGYGELVALDPASGAVAWRQSFDVAVGGAPTVADGKVFVVARDGSAWAVDARTGRVAWTQPGAPSPVGVAGASSPAVSGDMVLFPFSSGQITAAKIADGTPVWQAYVAGARVGRAYAGFSDLTGDPVISGGTVYAGSSAGRVTAIDMADGSTRWTARDGAMGPVVVAGNSLFLVNDENQLLRLDAATGAVTWRIDLPYFQNDKKDTKRKAIFAPFGPVLAGGRLIVASSDGLVRAFDPASGRLTGTGQLRAGAASAPVVAGGTLYVVTENGQLAAFR